MPLNIETLRAVERLLVAEKFDCAAHELIWNLGDWRIPIGGFSPVQIIRAIEQEADKRLAAVRREHYGCHQIRASAP